MGEEVEAVEALNRSVQLPDLSTSGIGGGGGRSNVLLKAVISSANPGGYGGGQT